MKRYHYSFAALALMFFISNAVADEPSQARQQVLSKMLKNDCGSCHGLTLKGGLGPSLLPSALNNKSDALLLQAIQEGRPGTPMPPWKAFLNQDETLWLIKKLRQP